MRLLFWLCVCLLVSGCSFVRELKDFSDFVTAISADWVETDKNQLRIGNDSNKTIKVGMVKEDVIKVAGKPDAIEELIKSYYYHAFDESIKDSCGSVWYYKEVVDRGGAYGKGVLIVHELYFLGDSLRTISAFHHSILPEEVSLKKDRFKDWSPVPLQRRGELHMGGIEPPLETRPSMFGNDLNKVNSLK